MVQKKDMEDKTCHAHPADNDKSGLLSLSLSLIVGYLFSNCQEYQK
jgi:hypothetical protein